MNIIVIVTGGIAAYKACEVVNMSKRAGHEVRVVMTESATHFITPLTLATLSAHPVHVDQFEKRHDVEHIELAKWAEAVLVAPATYNFIGKVANGIADDLASTVVAALPKDVRLYLAPAMNTQMWQNNILKENLKSLEAAYSGRLRVIPPRTGRLACGDEGEGILARPSDIVSAIGT